MNGIKTIAKFNYEKHGRFVDSDIWRTCQSNNMKMNSFNAIPGFNLLGVIGAGSFGVVKYGEDRATKTKYAVKVLNYNALLEKKFSRCLSSEVDNLTILSSYSHPHIIHLHSTYYTKEDAYLIMEFAVGGSLQSYLEYREFNIPEYEGRRFFQQIISGLEFCHSLKIVHRDLKLDNLLLDVKGNIKIADFGFSNNFTDEGLLQSSCGTFCYASPEILKGKPYKGPEVDIWSCGVILFVLLAGYHPFKEKCLKALLCKLKAGNLNIPFYVRNKAHSLIRNMLSYCPRKRAKIEDIKKHPWFKNEVAENNCINYADVGVNALNNCKAAIKEYDNFKASVHYARPIEIEESVYDNARPMEIANNKESARPIEIAYNKESAYDNARPMEIAYNKESARPSENANDKESVYENDRSIEYTYGFAQLKPKEYIPLNGMTLQQTTGALNQISGAPKQLSGAPKEISGARKPLSGAPKQFSDARKQISCARTQLSGAHKLISGARKHISGARKHDPYLNAGMKKKDLPVYNVPMRYKKGQYVGINGTEFQQFSVKQSAECMIYADICRGYQNPAFEQMDGDINRMLNVFEQEKAKHSPKFEKRSGCFSFLCCQKKY